MMPHGHRATRRWAVGVAALALGACLFVGRPATDVEARAAMGPVQRLIGPLASVAASVEWARYWKALDRGDEPNAYVHASRALSLDARSAAGWMTLADHFVFTRASPLEVSGPEEKRRWVRAGFEVLRAGEERVAAPDELAIYAAQIRAVHLSRVPDADLGWPGGPQGLLDEARSDLERAARSGDRRVVEVLEFIELREAELDGTLPSGPGR